MSSYSNERSIKFKAQPGSDVTDSNQNGGPVKTQPSTKRGFTTTNQGFGPSRTTRKRRKIIDNKAGEGGLCEPCRGIDFDQIFNLEVTTCGSRQSRGERVFTPDTLGDTNSACVACAFFRKMAARVDISASKCDLVAYSARAAFKIEKDAIPNSVMLGILPRKNRRRGDHPLKTGDIIMECSDNPGIITGRIIGPKIDFKLIQSWLSFCDNNHTKLCEREDITSISGLRVISCKSSKVIEWSYIKQPAMFATLSYLWGDGEANCSLVDGSLPGDVPKVISDAILATLSMGFEYLWVDRYCIPQDHTKQRDHQIRNMNIIYGASDLTIIAAAGEDPSYGLPGVGDTTRECQPSLQIGNRTLVGAALHFNKRVLRSKWNSRGWTYQEAMLAKRRLVFTNHLVYFQCCGMHCVETISAPLDALHTVNQQRMRDRIDIARLFPLRGLGNDPLALEHHIKTYANRQLSRNSDSLSAFQGVLRKFEMMSPPVRNLSGLPIYHLNSPEASLVIGLGWRLSNSSKNVKNARLPVRKTGFPSWSWLGWDIGETPRWHISYNLRPYRNSGPARAKIEQRTLQGAYFPVEFRIQLGDGTCRPWKTASDEIMDLASTGIYPKALLIKAYVADIYRLCGEDVSFPDIAWATGDAKLPRYSELVDTCQVRYWLSDATRDFGNSPQTVHERWGPVQCYRLIFLGYLGGLSLFLIVYRPENSHHYERLSLGLDDHNFGWNKEEYSEYSGKPEEPDSVSYLRLGFIPEGWKMTEMEIM